jgi:hypothetical protein
MRFTIRDLLWLTLLAAVAVAWWVERSRLLNEIESLRKTRFGSYWIDDQTGLDEFIELLNQQAKLPTPSAPGKELPSK